MLVLFETPAGYALFKVKNEAALKDSDALQKQFEDPEGAAKVLKLQAFAKFTDTVEVCNATATYTSACALRATQGIRFSAAAS